MGDSRVRTFVLLWLALILPDCPTYGQRPRAGAGKIKIAAVESRPVTVRQTYPCRVVNSRRVFVASPIEGRIAAVLVQDGQDVRKGDVLIQVRPLGDGTRPEAEGREKLTAIEAPCDGQLIGRLPSPIGTRAPKGSTLAVLSDERAMMVQFDVPEERYLAYMAERGETGRSPDLELILPGGREYPHSGKVESILASFANTDGHVTFQAEFPNPDHALRPDQVATLVVKSVLKDVILVPRSATFDDPTLAIRTKADQFGEIEKQGESTNPKPAPKRNAARLVIRTSRQVYVVGKDHVAHRREINTVEDADDVFVIDRGIKSGERIVVEGVGSVRDGDKVE